MPSNKESTKQSAIPSNGTPFNVELASEHYPAIFMATPKERADMFNRLDKQFLRNAIFAKGNNQPITTEDDFHFMQQVAEYICSLPSFMEVN